MSQNDNNYSPPLGSFLDFLTRAGQNSPAVSVPGSGASTLLQHLLAVTPPKSEAIPAILPGLLPPPPVPALGSVLPAPPTLGDTPPPAMMGIRHCQNLVRSMMRRRIAIGSGRVLPTIDNLPILEGRKIRAAFLYSDLDGYSKIVATQTADASLRLLQVFVDVLGRITSHFGGAAVNCAGDRVLSVFARAENDFSAEPVHEAMTAALWMQTIIQRVIAPEFRAAGFADVTAAMGIDYGPVVAGCVGYRNNKHFQFFGDAANYAAKLQEMGAGGEIVVSKLAYLLGPEFLKNGSWSPVDEGVRVRLRQRFADNVVVPPKI